MEFTTALPRTLTGKLQRYRLRADAGGTSPGLPLASVPSGDVRIHEPAGWPQPKGYASAVSATGRTVCVSGQIGWDPVTHTFRPAGSRLKCGRRSPTSFPRWPRLARGPDQIVRLTWYLTDRDEYLRLQREIGEAYRAVIGRHFPAMSVVVVQALVETRARVEIEATAIVV